MRILFAADVPPDPDSGAAGTEWRTIQALRELGHQVDEIWASDLGRRIQHGNLHYLLELPRAYRRVIEERCGHTQYDVFHVNQGHCFLAARAHRLARRPGVFVCRSHGLDDHMNAVLAEWRKRLGLSGGSRLKRIAGAVLRRMLQRHDRLAYRWADGVIVSGSHDARYLTGRLQVPAARVACIPQAPAPAFVDEPVEEMDGSRSRRLLHVGGFAYWKGVHAVAEAANQLLAADANCQLTWVCRAHEHVAVRALLRGPALERVALVGWMPQDALRSVYDRHGVFLCPSLFDGFGKVFLEAMARGMCVVGTRTGGMPDVIRDGVDGMLVGFDDPAAITSAVRRLWTHPDLARSVSVAAATRARQYSWNRVARETVAFYEHLLQPQGASASPA